MNPDNVTVLIGRTVQIMCRAIGTNIGYQWMKDDAVVSGSETRKLRLTDTQESDEGAYKCRASNKGGMVVSNPAAVTVYGELRSYKCKSITKIKNLIESQIEVLPFKIRGTGYIVISNPPIVMNMQKYNMNCGPLIF